ncbi:MAG TPA: 1,4-alpha-glucan branching protein domain-containing protein [Pyrinomonadaceae bacterium]|nr:1,4-alpha-glucan branching protein domain-containing protein [Pyrinomonadaceae bacterium]
MPAGYFSLILHAHLPFVRHPEHREMLEEDWLFEAITEVYLPLVGALARLRSEGFAPRLALSLSPTLCEMLSDDLLRARYDGHLDNLLALAGKELLRTFREEPQSHPAARFNYETLRAAKRLWEETCARDLVRAFGELQDAGALEIITCAATHGLLPLVSTAEARRAQVRVAAANYRKHFKRAPRGVWLPECAYTAGLEELLAEAGVEYFVVESHAVLNGEPRPRYGVHAPVRCANGVAAFARDLETGEQVWSASVGYPGDPAYREFYRDLGWDAPLEHLRPHLHADGRRRSLGIKYHRVTGRDVPLSHKQPYDPQAAAERARAHARHFVGERVTQVVRLRDALGGRAPVVVAPYDAELFGHWWFEGAQFLECVFRLLPERRGEIEGVTPGDRLDAGEATQTQRLAASSWGEGGHFAVWLNDENAWMYPLQHAAEARMTALADRFCATNEQGPHEAAAGGPEAGELLSRELTTRALKQCARELLLAQSSDWAFQIHGGSTADYAAARFRSHVARFNALAGGLERGEIDEPLLAEIERRDNLFAEIDPEVYRSRTEAAGDDV